MDPNDWTLTGNAGTDPAINFLGTTDNEPLVIRTNDAEHLRITPDGNVGIGITTPLTKLEVDGQTYINNITRHTFGNQLSLNVNGPNWGHFYEDGSERLYFGASDRLTAVPSSPIMTWDLATGNVGIGTTNPTQKLQVAGQGFFTSSSASPDPGDGSGTGIRIGYQDTDDYGYINANTTGVAAKRLILQQNGGNVGIGTTTPGRRLTLAGGPELALRLQDNTVPTGAFWELQPSAFLSDHFGIVRYEGGVAQESKSLVIDSAGRVGIGTSSPGSQLEVRSDGSTGVFAVSKSGVGMWSIAQGQAAGVFAESLSGTGILALGSKGGDFTGGVDINGNLNVSGNKFFKIDHPLDAAKKYLYHASVESPDMKNIYDGVVVLDARGEAEVTLPAWFDTLNTDFRYQLTAIGAAGPDLYIVEEISTNRFKIAGGQPNMKVCWQVTGIRQDAWAKAHPLSVEEDKPASEQGYYLHPELYGESEQKSIVRARYPELEIPVLPKK